MTKPAFFITGTDTDVGKTYISCSVLEAANQIGLSTAAIKPIAAGGININGKVHNEDALALQNSSSLALSYSEVNPICFEQAIAPHIAAKNESKGVKALELASTCSMILQKEADITVIEGAGGWRVPLNETEYMSDLVQALDVPVILVVGMRLGCLNHAILSVESILGDKLKLAGWIANQIDPVMQNYEENLAALKLRIPAPMLAEIAYEENFSGASNCAKQININAILQAF